jgi:hypothetical protein
MNHLHLRARNTGTVLLAVALLCPLAVSQEPPLPSQPPGPHCSLDASRHAGAPSFAHGQPVVGTTYFYWYDEETKAHVVDPDGTDAMTTHAADMANLSYKRASWHRTQLEDMMDAGIDFLMPVFWGVPGKYDGWSFAGLPPLVAAHDALLGEGRTPPAIGLFYDTSILEWNGYNPDGSNYHVDLTTDFGRRWFYTAMRDFFSLIPPATWARVDGKPIIFLYGAGFAKAQEPDQLKAVCHWFREDFECDPFIVKMRDWQGDADAVYQWGGAVDMQMDEHVAALGPGYDHSAVPGRTPVVVDRQDGRVYAERWLRLLRLKPQRRPWMIHVETWNEWHEGTDIARSREYGRAYLVLTRIFSDMWRAGEHLKPVGPYVSVEAVSWTEGLVKGIDVFESPGDGLYEVVKPGAQLVAVATRRSEISPDSPYLYFDVDEGFALSLDGGDVALTVTYLDSGFEHVAVEYDSTDLESSIRNGAFRHAGSLATAGSGEWKTAAFELPECWFTNRANGADFRFAVRGDNLRFTVRKVALRRK